MQAPKKEAEGATCFVLLLSSSGSGHSCGAVAQLPGRMGGPSVASVATGAGLTAEGGPLLSARGPRDPQYYSLGGQWRGMPAEVQQWGSVCPGMPPKILVSDGANDYMCG